MLTSKVKSKGQITVPQAVRERLGLNAGDVLVFDYEGQGSAVAIRKAQPFDRAWHDSLSATLNEWNSPEDEEAFRDL